MPSISNLLNPSQCETRAVPRGQVLSGKETTPETLVLPTILVHKCEEEPKENEKIHHEPAPCESPPCEPVTSHPMPSISNLLNPSQRETEEKIGHEPAPCEPVTPVVDIHKEHLTSLNVTTNNDASAKPKFNPNASPFLPVKLSVTGEFKLNPTATAFVPSSMGPPLNAPVGPRGGRWSPKRSSDQYYNSRPYGAHAQQPPTSPIGWRWSPKRSSDQYYNSRPYPNSATSHWHGSSSNWPNSPLLLLFRPLPFLFQQPCHPRYNVGYTW